MANVKTAVALVLESLDQLSVPYKLNTVMGTNTDNLLNGTNNADAIYGLGGNDQLYGQGGNDFLDGGLGADRMTGGIGNDTYVIDNVGDRTLEEFGQGLDTVIVGFAASGPGLPDNPYTLGSSIEDGVATAYTTRLTGNSAHNHLWVDSDSRVAVALAGLDGDDTLELGKLGGRADGGNGNDVLRGNEAVDYLAGGAGDDRMLGANGNDNLRGQAGNDYLDGGLGDDELYGDEGADRLRGGGGNDLIFGGRGADSFIVDTLGSVSTIRDFSVSEGDKLDLRNLVQTGGADPFAAGYVRLVEFGGPGASSVAVQVDSSGGGDGFTTVAVLKDQTLAQLGHDFFLYL